MKFLSQWEAAELLASYLKGTPNEWFGFLTKNCRSNSNENSHYKITAHVVDGKQAYTQEALLEFIRVHRTPHITKSKTKDKTMQEASDQLISEIVLNILHENDGSFDLNTVSGVQEASEYAAYYYNLAGVNITEAQIKHELKRRIKAFKELNLM